MSMDSRVFLSACVILGPAVHRRRHRPSQSSSKPNRPAISSAYTVGTTEGATYVTIVNDSPGFGPPATADGALTYSVTFPAAGKL